MARPETHPVRKLISLDAALLERIRDFRFGARIASENAAIRELIARGLNTTCHGGRPT